jgi:hypothetical protein
MEGIGSALLIFASCGSILMSQYFSALSLLVSNALPALAIALTSRSEFERIFLLAQ